MNLEKKAGLGDGKHSLTSCRENMTQTNQRFSQRAYLSVLSIALAVELGLQAHMVN
jgi:hypothetical protein